MNITKFSEDLKEFFPELSGIYELGKQDAKVFTVINTMVDMLSKKTYGKIEITYQDGRINHIYQTSNRE